jgi:hypothetical protein
MNLFCDNFLNDTRERCIIYNYIWLIDDLAVDNKMWINEWRLRINEVKFIWGSNNIREGLLTCFWLELL